MAGLFGLSVSSQTSQRDFQRDLFWGTFYQQHWGEDYCGLATCDDGEIKKGNYSGLFRPNFSKNLKDFGRNKGIGYCGSAPEPYLINSKLGKFAICFSGNIINLAELVERFKSLGHTFEREDDIEVIANLVAQGNNLVDGIKKMSDQIKGAFSLCILSEEGIYAALCPNGRWPLVIGKKQKAVAVASDPSGFSNLGFEILRELKPGEIILVKNGEFEVKDIISGKGIQTCSFLWVYTLFPAGIIKEIPASLVRKRLGAALARRDIERGFIPDIVAGVQDSGRFHAIGYFQEFCRQMNAGRINRVPLFDELLLKYPYAGRSFTPQEQEVRDLEAYIKQLKSGEGYDGLVVVICDDSIVRGTQTKNNFGPKLRDLGVKEIHFRISNPELYSHCPWGKTIKKGETLAFQKPSIIERIEFLKIESLEYNTIEDLVKAIGLPREQLCVDCSLKI